jgi:hypothetical protein
VLASWSPASFAASWVHKRCQPRDIAGSRRWPAWFARVAVVSDHEPARRIRPDRVLELLRESQAELVSFVTKRAKEAQCTCAMR